MTKKMATQELGERYNQLKAEGKTAREAAQIVKEESGTDVKLKSIQGYGSRVKTQERSESMEHGEGGSAAPPLISEPGTEAASKRFDHAEPASEAISEERIREIAHEVFQEMIQGLDKPERLLNPEEEPPAPAQLDGRKQDRKYEKIAVTVDRELWLLFLAETKQKGISRGRLLDSILWRHYDRPVLSYQRSQDTIEGGEGS